MSDVSESTGTLEHLRGDAATVIARYPQPRSALLPLLHLVQSDEGYVSSRGIDFCADVLGLTPAEVSAVATFYTMYKRTPVGRHHVGVCTNTLCAVMGGDAIFERLKDHLDIGNDETTDDGRITLEHLECNAACDFAPVMMVNWEFMDNMDPASATRLVDDLREGKEVRSTRGPRICTWREAERVLAGYPDDLADEGPAAGPHTAISDPRRILQRLHRDHAHDAGRSAGLCPRAGGGRRRGTRRHAHDQVDRPLARQVHASSRGSAHGLNKR